MKRQILSLATALVLMTGGAVFAQSTLNTQAPGPSQETKPGQTNNNLQNPGSNMQKPATTTTTTAPSTETTTTTTAPVNDSTVTPPADTTTTTAPVETTTTTTTTTPATSTPPTTGTYTGSSTDTTTTTTAPSSLPKTASDLPTVALMGLLALSGFFAVRVYAKRNA